MIRVSRVLKSLALAALVGGVLPAAAQAQANGTYNYASDGSYTVTDPATGNVYYYNASGKLQYYTAIDPATGDVGYFYPNGSVLDPLHGFCGTSWASTTCTDNNTVTPEGKSKPQFGFVSSPSGATGTFYVEILIPTNEDANPSSLTFTLTNGTTHTSTYKGLWDNGNLTDFLSRPADPKNPLDAWLPYTQNHGDAGDTGQTAGYYVYDVKIGTATLDGTGPLLNFTAGSPGLQAGSVIVGFLNDGTSQNPSWISTAQSAALFFDHSLPEPGSGLLVLSGLLGLGFFWQRQRRAVAV